jgi:hypothetical protein
VLVVSFSGNIHATDADVGEIVAFFQSVEESFKKKDIPEIIGHIHKDFSYIMTYSTNENFSFLESDFEKYRANVGSFFKNKPEILEYSIIVDDIQRSGEDIMVLARLKSVVQLNDIINSCDASANYLVQKVNNKYLIKEVRGDADCTNMLVE